MTRLAVLLGLATSLAACGTPQERCIRSATKDLRTVRALADETRLNLARGYAYEETEITRTEWVVCGYVRSKDGEKLRPDYCLDDVTDIVRRTVAIDPALEKRKLDALVAKDRELSALATRQIAGCRATYPEE